MQTATENTPKFQLEEIDEFYRQKTAREESRVLSRISRIVLSAWDLAVQISRLPVGESIVINREGEVFQGKVQTNKLQEIPGKMPKLHQSEFDTEGFQEFMNTKSFVQSPGSPLKNGWTKCLKTPRNTPNAMVDLILEKMESIKLDDILAVDYVVGIHGESFMEFTLKDFPAKPGIFQKTGTIYYYYFEGKKYDVR